MAKCGIKWVTHADYEGLLLVKTINVDIPCAKEKGHEGRHGAQVKSKLNNEVAIIEWPFEGS